MRFRDLLNRRGIAVRRGTKENEIYICCPFCTLMGTSPDTRFRLGVNLSSGLAHCYNCDWRSYGNRTFAMIAQEMGYRGQLDTEFEPPEPAMKPEEPTPKTQLPSEFIRFAGRLDYLGSTAFRYLRERGLTLQQIQRKRVGYAISGRYSHRVIFPVLDGGRGVLGFVARDWTKHLTPPYLNSKGLDRTLYNIDALLRRGWSTEYPLVVAEGVFDCLAVERAGYACVATLGRHVTENQLDYLVHVPNVTIFADFDMDGIDSAVTTAKQLKESCKEVRIALPVGGKDAGDLAPEAIRQSMSAAKPFTLSYGRQLRFAMMNEV